MTRTIAILSLCLGLALASCTTAAVTASAVIAAVQATCGFTLTGGIDELIKKYQTVDAIRDFVCGLVTQPSAKSAPTAGDPTADREIGKVDGVPITGHFEK